MENIIDVFTKALGLKQFKYFIEKIGLVNIEEISLKANRPREDDSGLEDQESRRDSSQGEYYLQETLESTPFFIIQRPVYL